MYDWKRFWIPSGGAFRLDDDGFLYDPEAQYGRRLNPDAVSFSELHAKNCLVLLGEPGIGKSVAVEQELAACRATFTPSQEIISINLGEYGDETRLIEDTFKSTAAAKWATGSHVLHLFLDSLDECGLQIPHVAKVLRNGLGRLMPHLPRLRLRIACRTADWPASLTEALDELWNQSQAVYELLPLRRTDIALAATQKGCDGNQFIEELIRIGVQSLAIKPVTLEFLIAAYKSDGGFPSRQGDLYNRGCHLFCEESNQDRRDARQFGLLSAQRRFVVAQRIAAALILGNKSSITLAHIAPDKSPTSLAVTDLIGGTEVLGTKYFEVGTPEIEDVLRTGLFSGRGEGRVGFAHHTYAEFLAARYLENRIPRLVDRMNLLRNGADDLGKIVPQLAETAAWLAGMDKNAFDEVMRCDPQVLVRSDVAKADESDRQLLVKRLLELFALDEIREARWDEQLDYRKLNHPQLSDQLGTVVRDRSQGQSARSFAITVARVCARRDLQSLLGDLALDETEDYAVRVAAAYALVAIGDETSHLRLKPLALKKSRGDKDLAIKALVLRTLWPKHISADEVFPTLSTPEPGTYGTYRHFLNYELPDGLTAAHLPQALRWASRLSDAEVHDHSIRQLFEKLSRLAWTHLDDPEVRDAMVDFLIARLRGSADLMAKDLDSVKDQPEDRRMLVEAIVARMDDIGSRLSGLIYCQPVLLRKTDFFWLLKKVANEGDDKEAEHWIGLIEHLFDPMAPGHLDAALPLCARNRSLDAALRPMYEPIALDSETARRLRKQFVEREAMVRRVQEQQKPAPLDPPPAVRLEQHLKECEDGNTDSWLLVTYDLELELEPSPSSFFLAHEEDLTSLPGWKNADAKTRSRIVEGAPHYLSDHRAGVDWLGTGSIPYEAFAGYRALLLLAKESPDLFRRLPETVWERWAPIIVSYHVSLRADDSPEPHNKIARTCAERAPTAVNECLSDILNETATGGDIFILPEFVERAWNGQIEQSLLSYVNSENPNPDKLDRLLEALLLHRSDGAKKAAQSFFYPREPHVPPHSCNRRRNAVVAAKALMRHADDAGWDAVWPALRSDQAFGREVVMAVAIIDSHNPSIVTRLSERDAAEFYVWLAKKYPHEDDGTRNRATRSARDAVSEYRDSVLRAIEHRGTTEAIDALLWIASQLSRCTWMKWVIASARQITLQATWRPVAAKDIIDLAQSPNSSLVRGPADLQDVILESLKALEVLLQGETPAARDLWDKGEAGVFRPVDENDLSNYVKRHLEQDLKHRGIVALREVEIRRGEGGAEGERTDLHITGLVRGLKEGTVDQVRVIVEVKCPWHPHVDTAMETQLVNRYLRDNTCQHGIYLVGWYQCPQWNRESSSYKRSRKETLESAARRFATQAAALTNDSRRIRSFMLNAALR